MTKDAGNDGWLGKKRVVRPGHEFDFDLEGQNRITRQFALDYLERKRLADEAERQRLALEKQVRERTARWGKYDEVIDRFKLEFSGARFKYAAVGEQSVVDKFVERIKDGNLTDYVRIIGDVNRAGCAVPPAAYQKEGLIVRSDPHISGKQWDEWDEAATTRFLESIDDQGLEKIRKGTHMSKDQFSDREVAEMIIQLRLRMEAITSSAVQESFRIFGDQQKKYVEAIDGTTAENPFIIDDPLMKERWREAMEGPDGVLAKNFIFDQRSFSIPGLVAPGYDNSLTFTNAFDYT